MAVRTQIALMVLSRFYIVERELPMFKNLFPVETTKEFIFPIRNSQV